MATGSGKTVVMAMLISWAFCNRGTKPGDPRFPRRALIVCPNLTIKERLAVLRPDDPDNYYEKFDLVPSTLRVELAKGKVFVTNWHWFSPESEVIKVGGVTVGKIGAETSEAFAQNRLGDLWDTEPLMVFNDEGHHAYRPAQVGEDEKLTPDEKADREEATVWVSGLDKINSACGISLCVDMSATPFYIHGSGYPEGSPFPWIVSDFSLVDAIESGITKIPRLPAIDNTGQPDPKYFKLWEHITRDLKAGEKFTGGKVKSKLLGPARPSVTIAVERDAFDFQQPTAAMEFRRPPHIPNFRDRGKQRSLGRKFAQEGLQTWADLQNAQFAGLLPAIRKRAFIPFNVRRRQICAIGLGRANFPQKLVIMPPFFVILVFNDLLMLRWRDGAFRAFGRFGPKFGWDNRAK
jgi:type III restriction enzyme